MGINLCKKSHERIIKVCSSSKVKAAEKVVARRTKYVYFFEDDEVTNTVRIYGHMPSGALTSISVRL